MSASFVHSWASCERLCFDYLQTALGTIEGAQGFTPENFPREMTGDESYWFIWTFRISGGAMDVQRQARTEATGGVWHMDAEFTALCASDAVAKQVGGTVVGALPVADTDVPGLSRLYATQYPAIERVVKSLLNGENAGQEKTFFEVRVPMRAAFSNIDEVSN
jgi:hypothetical protein